MGKPFDITKFRKELTKSIDGMGFGFNDPTDWISTGNWALNYRISGNFDWGIPLGKVTVFAGESGSGKSFICSGNIIKHAQAQGIFVVLVDTENALDESWLQRLGVDTSESKLLKLNISMIDALAKTISMFMKDYKAIPEGEEKPKVLFVIDSLGMMLTPTVVDQFDKGDMKGDMGRKPKALTSLVRNCVNMFGSHNVGLVATNHTYASQDMFDPDDTISGGCLTAGHKVRMADGSATPIEDIQIGDVVVTLEGNIAVAETFTFFDKEVFELELETGEIIQATGEHKFLIHSDGGALIWKTVSELVVTDEIMSLEKIKIKSKKSIGILPVYDICVPGAHHYLLDSGVVSHNSGFIYASSIVVAMRKLKLKEDADGNKVSDVLGIRAACKVMKTRYAKPFESVQIKIPYDTGMSPHSGMTDLLEKIGLLTKDGNRLIYNLSDGSEIKAFRRVFETNENSVWETIIQDLKANPGRLNTSKATEVDTNAD